MPMRRGSRSLDMALPSGRSFMITPLCPIARRQTRADRTWREGWDDWRRKLWRSLARFRLQEWATESSMQLFIEIWTMIENWARLNRMKREARIAEVGASISAAAISERIEEL